uniref:Uncharacterized protein n=1 Tax=Arundo donax TaxID=35708 RepID=A0A0A9EDD5_ARUDO
MYFICKQSAAGLDTQCRRSQIIT